MSKKISLLSLSLLIISAIDSIRNLPSSALFGSTLLFFFLFSALLFLFPTALISAELTAAFPKKGGVYHWVLAAFGEKTAMLAIWLQWINTMVWYPTILSFLGATATYFIAPELSQNKLFLATTTLVIFWSLTLINLRGIHVSARFNAIAAVTGTILPMGLLIVLGGIYLFSGQPLQISFDNLLPDITHPESWTSLIAIMASFLGMELAGVHVNDIDNPQKNFPKAIIYSALFILLTMLFGSLAVAFVIPASEMNLTAGIMQTFNAYGLARFAPILTVLIVFGTLGNMVNWLISPAKGLLHAAELGYLPKVFTRLNQHGVSTPLLCAQAIVVSLLCLVFFLVPSVNAFYWFLMALSTALYMLMYILMFAAAVKLRTPQRTTFQIPGGRFGLVTVAFLGLAGAILTIVVGFFPPEHVDVGSRLQYHLMIAAGLALMVSPVFLFYAYKKRYLTQH